MTKDEALLALHDLSISYPHNHLTRDTIQAAIIVLSAPAALTPVEGVESAEAFAQRQAEWIRAAFDFELRVSSLATDVRDRDLAIAAAAERAGYLRALADAEGKLCPLKGEEWVEDGIAAVLAQLRSKLTQPKEPTNG